MPYIANRHHPDCPGPATCPAITPPTNHPLTRYMEGYEFESQLHYQNSPSLIMSWILSPLLPL
jgi:hypothetical protein